MFDNLKKIKELKELQDSMAQERFESEKEGTRVVMNGNMEIEEVSLNPDLSKENQERVLRDLLNETAKKVQSAMAQKFQGMI